MKITYFLLPVVFLSLSCGEVETTANRFTPSPISPETGTEIGPEISNEEEISVEEQTDVPPTLFVTDIRISIRDAVLSYTGDRVPLTASLTYSDELIQQPITRYYYHPSGQGAGQVVWYSSDPDIASVSSHGIVQAQAPGEVIITVNDPWSPGFPSDQISVQVLDEDFADPEPDPDPDPEPEPEPEPDPLIEEELVPPGADPFADEVVSYTIGNGGGFHEAELPEIVLGAPLGGGCGGGGLDVFSLGSGGEIILEFDDYIIFDGEGVDFIVFENGFCIGGNPENIFSEPGIISVSQDGETFYTFSCDLSDPSYPGCAGTQPTHANTDNDIDPTDPAVAGGNAFDLAIVGLQTARFVKIQDSALVVGPPGSGVTGFDLDAVSIVHGTSP